MYTTYGELCTEVYDISKPLGYSTGDVEYYLERLKDIKGKALEVGCGSGRILIPLLQAGIAIDGLDNSKAMLDSCSLRCKELNLFPTLIEDEMYSFIMPQQYEAIIIPGGTFQLLEGRELALTTLNHLKANLLPGGKLILDLFIPTDFNTNATSTKTWLTKHNEVLVLEDKRIEVNMLEQYMVSLLKYEKWQEGTIIKSELQRFPLSWYGLYEFKLLLEKIGFMNVTISADYKYMNLPKQTGQMITYEAINQ